MRESESVARLGDIVGNEVSDSEWLEVRQERIDHFATLPLIVSGIT